MPIIPAIRTALAYAGDLPRAMARDLLDRGIARGLGLLASCRPTRVVAREDYMLRSYLLGRMGHGFPEGTKATLGSLDAAAYLHCIRTPDAGRSHHSHPWKTAVSLVISGGYDEEVVEADGSITVRERRPGSVAVINSSTFHRITRVYGDQAWTLFFVGQRVPGRAWYFRRPDGSIVHEKVYHANLEAERVIEEQLVAEQDEVRAMVEEIERAAGKRLDEGLVLTSNDIKAFLREQYDAWVADAGLGAESINVDRDPEDPDRFTVTVPEGLMRTFDEGHGWSTTHEPSPSSVAELITAEFSHEIGLGIAASQDCRAAMVDALSSCGWFSERQGWMSHPNGGRVHLYVGIEARGKTGRFVWSHGDGAGLCVAQACACCRDTRILAITGAGDRNMLWCQPKKDQG